MVTLGIAVAQLVEHKNGDRRVAGSSLTAGHSAVSLSKTLYPLLSTGSTQEDRPA